MTSETATGPDELAEEFRPLLSWAEAVRQHHAMLRTEPPFITTAQLSAAIDRAFARLRRSQPATEGLQHSQKGQWCEACARDNFDGWLATLDALRSQSAERVKALLSSRRSADWNYAINAALDALAATEPAGDERT